MRYVFLGYADPSVERTWTPEQLTEVINQHVAFSARMRAAGKLIAAIGLDAGDTATVLHRRADGSFTVTDGPFIESKEQIGGLYILECDDLDEALALAREIPFSDSQAIEVRPAPH